jgi:hypothetical protein
MTTRELYNMTINYLNGDVNIDAKELADAFTAALEKMDTQAASRRVKQAEKAAAKQAEKAPIRDALLAILGGEDEPKTASMLVEEITDYELKAASIPSLMRPLCEAGIVGKVDMKVPGHGTQRGYIKL